MQTIRVFKELIINKKSKISQSEILYAQDMHKKAYIQTNIKKNKYIDQGKIYFFRTNSYGGLGRLDLYKKKIKTKKNLNKNIFLKRKDIKI